MIHIKKPPYSPSLNGKLTLEVGEKNSDCEENHPYPQSQCQKLKQNQII